MGDMAVLSAALVARRRACKPVFGCCREPVLARGQGRIAGIEHQLFAARLELAPKRIDDLHGLVQGRGALRGFENGVGQIHGAIVSLEFIGAFLLLSRARGDAECRCRPPSAGDPIDTERRAQRAEQVRLGSSGTVGETSKFEPKTVSSVCCDFSSFFVHVGGPSPPLLRHSSARADVGRQGCERLLASLRLVGQCHRQLSSRRPFPWGYLLTAIARRRQGLALLP